MSNNIHYRIYVINDFNAKSGCIEFHSYAKGMILNWASFQSRGEHRGFHRAEDCIDIFLNYNKVGTFKDKASAMGIVKKLIKECPKECKKEFEEWADDLTGIIDTD